MAGTVSFSVPVDGGTEATEEPKIPTALTTLRDALNAVLSSSNKLDGAQVQAGTIAAAGIAAAAGIPISKLDLSAVSGDASSTSGGVFTLSTAALAKSAAAYRTILTADGLLWDTGGGNPGAATYLLGSSSATSPYGMQLSASFESATPRVVPPRLFYFAHADHDVTSLTTKLRLRTQVATNATASGVTFSFGLFPVTVAGTADAIVYTAGTIVPSSIAIMATPSASTVAQTVTADFTVPSDGAYLLAVITNQAMANNSAVSCHAQLQVRNV